MANLTPQGSDVLLNHIRRYRDLVASLCFEDAEKELSEAARAAQTEKDKQFVDVVARLGQVMIEQLRAKIAPAKTKAICKELEPKLERLVGLKGVVPDTMVRSEIARCLASRNEIIPAVKILHSLCMGTSPEEYDFNRLLMSLLKLRQFGEAKLTAERWLRVFRGSIDAYQHMGGLLLLEREYRAAIDFYEYAREQGEVLSRPTHMAFNNMGLAYYWLGNSQAAERQLRKGFEVSGDRSFFLNNQAFLRFKTLEKKGLTAVLAAADELVDTYGKAIFKRGEGYHPNAHFNLWYITFLKAKSTADEHLLRETLDGFVRTAEMFRNQRQLIQAVISMFFAARCRRADIKNGGNPHSLLLEELLNDVENSVTDRLALSSMHGSFLARHPDIPSELYGDHVGILERWQAEISPYPRELNDAGGGYFVRWKGIGVVIDPGLNFITNFQQAGYVIADIDGIVVTDASPCRSHELELLLMLIRECRRKLNGRPKAPTRMVLSRSAARRFATMLEAYDGELFAIHDLTPNSVVSLTKDIVVTGRPTFVRTEAGEVADGRGVGVVLDLLSDGVRQCSVGYLGDTAFAPELADLYGSCEVVVIPVGSVTFRELLTNARESEFARAFVDIVSEDKVMYLDALGFSDMKAVQDLAAAEPRDQEFLPGHHMGFTGTLRLVDALSKQAALRVSVLVHMANELGARRHMLAKVLNQTLKAKSVALTGDLSFRLSLPELKVMCDYEMAYVDPSSVTEVCVERESKAIKQICAAHANAADFDIYLTEPR